MVLRLENILESMSDAFVSLDKDWRYTFVNQRAVTLLSKSREELIGKNIWELFPDIIGTAFDFTYHAVLETGDPAGFEVYHDTHKIWLDVRAFAHDGGISVFYTDISLRKKAEAKIELNERRFKALVENGADAIAIISSEGKPVYISPSIRNVLGYTEDEAMTKKIVSLLHPEDIYSVQKLIQVVMANHGIAYQRQYVRILHKDRTWHWLDATIKNCLQDPAIQGIVINFRDVSDKLKAEMKNKMHDQEITRAIINTQEQERYIFGTELHDNINQILAGTLITLSVAKSSTNSDADNYIVQASEYINMAIEEIRKLSHRLAPASFDNETFKEAIENLLESYNVDKKFKIQLHFNSEPDCPINSAIQLNLYRISQEQLNNIQKYSNATDIEMNVINTVSRIVLRIYDNGIGFDKVKIKKELALGIFKNAQNPFSGIFKLNTSPDNGCEVVIDIPH